MKVKGKLGNCTQVTVYGSLSVITTLEFLEHHFAKVGHRSSPYDPTLSLPTHLHTPLTSGTRKRLPQSGFVQVRFWEVLAAFQVHRGSSTSSESRTITRGRKAFRFSTQLFEYSGLADRAVVSLL